ncbi:MAG: DUF1631 family protein [Cytophagales bacterium]|nr:DUF1631 family protein [Rhizobacter sp.]
MPIAPLLQRFVDDELNRSADLISRTLASTLEQLRQPRDSLLTASEKKHYFEVVQVLQQNQALYQRSFVETLRKLVLADLAPQATGLPGAGPLSPGGLELMDETRVESDIEISRAIQQIDTGAEWELRELQTFTSTLRGQAHVTAESNPLRPQSYARALWQAATAMPITPVQQAILLRVSATVIAGLLRMSFAAACTRLESAGVTPGIYRTVVIVPGSGRDEPPEMDVTRPGALDGLMRSMPGGITGPSSGGGGGGSGGGAEIKRRLTMPTASPALEQALLRVEELLRRMPATALGGMGAGAPQAPRLAQHRAELMATAAETVDRQIIELLSRLFETILSDPSLPRGVHAVIARLQVSALRIALLDPSMLDAYDHPVWVLMDRIVNATTAYPQASDPRLAALLTFCEALVGDMASETPQDTALYRRSISRLDSFLAEQLHQQQHQAQAAVDALTRAEQAEQLQRNLSGRLVEQMVPIQTSSVIRRFVTVTWARVLAEAVLHFGDQNEQTAGYLKAVDELLWSLKLPGHPQSRQRLVTLLPGLLQRLRAGMALIDVPTAEQQNVLDELMKVHSEALRPGPRSAPAPVEEELSPEEIVRRMREEVAVEPEPLDGSGFSDSLIDLASMETVPAALMNAEHATEPGEDPNDWVKHMAVGQRYRVFLHGAWSQVQLLWRSEQNHFFLFAGETAQHTHSVSLRALERLRQAELLGPLHAHSLIQRAVDGMLRNLARSS